MSGRDFCLDAFVSIVFFKVDSTVSAFAIFRGKD